jgi:uncharacterized protein (DUF1778 family)
MTCLAAMAIDTEAKTERIDIRTTLSAKQMLQEAAAIRDKTVSEFLLDSGLTAAAETLTDRRLFFLDEVQWTAFLAALDAPPKPQPRLEALLTEKGVFD